MDLTNQIYNKIKLIDECNRQVETIGTAKEYLKKDYSRGELNLKGDGYLYTININSEEDMVKLLNWFEWYYESKSNDLKGEVVDLYGRKLHEETWSKYEE